MAVPASRAAWQGVRRSLVLRTASFRTGGAFGDGVRALHAGTSIAARYRRFGDEPERGWNGDGGGEKGGDSEEVQRAAQDDGPMMRPHVPLSPSELWALGSKNSAQGEAIRRYVRLQNSGGDGGGGGGGGGSKKRFGRGRLRIDRNQLYLVGGVAGLGGVYYLGHLERVPETGRLRFMTVSVGQEREMGEEAFKQTLNQYGGRVLPANDPRVRFVRSVAARIVRATSDQQQSGTIQGQHLPTADGQHGVRPDLNDQAGGAQTQWEVFVINDDSQVNAFVLPNGKIFVFTGILPICKDEDGLATVLGHEVAHQVARHSAEKVSGSFVTSALGFLFEFIVPGSYMASRQALTLLKELPNSRALESEADRIGLRLMSAACYDPTHAPDLWRRMQEMEKKKGGGGGGGGLEIFSTHPVSERRMHNLEEWAPEALQIRQESGCSALPSPSVFNNAMRSSF